MKTILIIDDDEAVLGLFSQFLEAKDYAVLQAADGREGLRLFDTDPPDLVITDIMMPEMDGLEILQNLRKTSPDLPVIAISGGMRNATINFLPHAKTFGACRVFEKPVALSDLLQAVEELLGGTG
jgi:CheY-like chemotaxis protein